MSNWRRIAGASVLAGALVFARAGIASATVLDLTMAGASGSIGAAFFIQIDPQSTGTGVIDPFLRMQASGLEQGANSNGPYTMDEKPGPWTHNILVSDFDVVDLNGTPSIRFLLDINELSGSSLLSLDMLRIYVSPAATFNTLAQLDNPANATTLYDMDAGGAGDNWIKLDCSLNPGSGAGDMLVYLPYRMFLGHTWKHLYLYSRFGDNIMCDDGFEEWSRIDLAQLPCGSADSVVVFTPGSGTLHTSAANMLGAPDGEAVPLGIGGSVVLRMSDWIEDGPGIDFYIDENGVAVGAVDENFRVEASQDGVSFSLVGDGAGGSVGFDLGGSGYDNALFIRITDLPPQEPLAQVPDLGADIDAIRVMHCASTPPISTEPTTWSLLKQQFVK